MADELVNSPKEILKRFGIEYDPDIEVVVLQETENKKFFIIPQAPDENHIEEVLESGTIISCCPPPPYCVCYCSNCK